MINLFNKFYKIIKQKLVIFGPVTIYLTAGLGLGISSFLLFAKLSEDLLEDELSLFDNIVTSIVREHISSRITFIMEAISNMGSPTFIIIVSIISIILFLFIKKHIWDATQIPVVVLGSFFSNELLKFVFHRQRPKIPHFVEAIGLSFPSGHAMVSFSFYGILIYLSWINTENRILRMLIAIALGFIIFSIGISRIYLGVHYPSDVLAGFAAGCFWLVANIYGFKAIRYYKANK